MPEQDQQQISEHLRIRRIFHETFSTPAGQDILDFLANESCQHQSTRAIDDMGRFDTARMTFNEGRRSLMLMILEMSRPISKDELDLLQQTETTDEQEAGQ